MNIYASYPLYDICDSCKFGLIIYASWVDAICMLTPLKPMLVEPIVFVMNLPFYVMLANYVGNDGVNIHVNEMV